MHGNMLLQCAGINSECFAVARIKGTYSSLRARVAVHRNVSLIERLCGHVFVRRINNGDSHGAIMKRAAVAAAK
jgi:hypothetical protein